MAFDGNLPHCTLPFEGRRYTLVYWSHTLTNTLQPADRAFLARRVFLNRGLREAYFKPSFRLKSGLFVYIHVEMSYFLLLYAPI